MIELKNAGATVNEKERLNYLLRILPSSLSHIGDLVDVLPEQGRTVDYVINKIKLYENREKEENQNLRNRNSNVFSVERKKDGICLRCGKQGHFQYECTSQGNVRNSWRGSRGAGQQQAREGAHYQQHQQRGGNSHSRGNGDYRGRGAGQQGRGDQQRQEPQDTSRDPTTFITEVNGNNSVEVNNCESKIEWVLDSGCSDHIINDDKYFARVNKLENPIKVKVEDGHILRATSIGDIKAKFITKYSETEIEIKDVFFVKEMDRNLMSFGKVAENLKIVSRGNTAKIYNRENALIAVANKVNNLYKVNTVLENKQTNITENVNNGMTLKEKFHRMLGHVNFGYLNILSRNNLVEGLPSKLENDYL